MEKTMDKVIDKSENKVENKSEEEELEGYEPASDSDSESDREGVEAFENYEDEGDKVLMKKLGHEEDLSDCEADEGEDDMDVGLDEGDDDTGENKAPEEPKVSTMGGIRVPPWKDLRTQGEELKAAGAPTFTPAGPSVRLRIQPQK